MKRALKWGLLYVVLVVAGLGWYLRRYGFDQIGDLEALASALVAMLGLPAVVIAALRFGRAEPPPVTLQEVADGLAQAMREQWVAEAQVRRLNDPHPLPVAWSAADADLIEPWPLLRDLAESWPGGPPGDPTKWAAHPGDLAGEGADIDQVFSERLPTRRLVVLGEPGAGKTMLLIRLLLALLEHRPSGGPVPALFPLASWDPARQDLYTWMADQLIQDHPALRATAPGDPLEPSPGTRARALLANRLILPILDGLDELPEAVRPQALDSINQALPHRQPMVLSSRTAEYRETLASSTTPAVLLNGAAGIRLLPLDGAQAAAYLQRDAGGPATAAAGRWDSIAASLGTNLPAAQALSTPLGLFLARTIYNPRPDESPANLTHPAELLDQNRFATREDIDTHLFAAFIPAAYRPHPRHPSRWTPQQAQHALKFLAHHLEHTLGGTPNLAWWQLHKAFPQNVLALVAGLVFGLTVGFVFGFRFGIPLGLGCGLGVGFGTWLVVWSDQQAGPRAAFHWKANWFGVATGLVVGLAAWLAAEFVFELEAGLVLGVGLAMGLVAAVAFGLEAGPSDLARAVGPGSVLARDRRAYGIIALMSGLAFGLAFGVPVGLTSGFPLALATGLFVGVMFGLVYGLATSMWWVYLVARCGLAVLGRAPWRFMGFLADAHERRGVLRQTGAVYQFRHLDLQRHLARHQS
ncbi:NACHT domain-containing protein [Streptomyces massasporeus]